MISQFDMLRLLINHSDLDFKYLRTVGGAIGADFVDEAMATKAVSLAQDANWIVTVNQRGKIAIEPTVPEPAMVSAGTKLYHVSDRWNLEDILANGLKPGSGGNTTIGRGYAPRVHLAVRMRDAFQFTHFQITKRSDFVDGKPISPGFPKKFVDLDLFEVTSSNSHSFFRDHHFEGKGVWSDALIPAENLHLVKNEEWHQLYKKMYPEDSDLYCEVRPLQ
jgi:hypothetical protein